MNDNSSFEHLLRRCGLSERVLSVQKLSGGDISQAFLVHTQHGPLFAKVNHEVGLSFEPEALSLRLMAEVCHILRIPEVLGLCSTTEEGPGALVLSYVERGPTGGDFEVSLAEGLAEMHRATAPSFGFPCETYCGATIQPNPWTDSWSTFFVEHRLRHHASLMMSRGRIAHTRVFDQIEPDLPEPGTPALIHGDLWSGNIMADMNGRPVLIDPAAYYGCPEAELGMLTWLGGRSETFYRTYGEACGLPSDWRQRNPLYQLVHVMNHATLFGGSYVDQAIRLAQRLT
ncbi:MAG: fructosamine kinase family protein [Myxococcota bacterium]